MIHNPSVADTQNNKQPLLTISIVTFNPDFEELRKTLNSLKIALHAFAAGSFLITIVDNSNSDKVATFVHCHYPELSMKVVHGQGNIGFGRAHNIAIQQMGEFHLILNPDIQLNPDALVQAVAFMRTNEKCGMVSPRATWPNGQRQFLCKRYPAVIDLLLRGFAPKIIHSFFSPRLARYEMQAETQNAVHWNPPIVSGCFMFFRSAVLKSSGGFSDKFFLYFEDFDLSLRVREIAVTAYVPTIQIVHTGGNASKKGLWHIRAFAQSAITFYSIHGLKLL